jgi:FAD/FMN-containing dehydrogenase
MSDWDVLQAAIDAEVILPHAPGYEAARKPALARFHASRPRAVVLARSADAVAGTIRFAQRNGWRTTPRSGGHCFAGRSSLGDVVIDVSPMGTVSVSDGLATVGAGTRLGPLDDALTAHGRMIPAGCGPSVGIAGLALGGGLGILGRKYGLTCDQLVSARVVLADGRVLDCDEHHDEALLWALRGAGGGHFGVVTSLVFTTVPALASTCFHLVWSPVHAAAVIDAWQSWAPTAPDEMNASLRLTVAGDAGSSPVVNLLGAMLGTESGTELLLGEFAALVGADPVTEFVRSMPYGQVKRHLSGLGSIDTASGQQQRTMLSKSEFFRQPLPGHAIAAVVDNLTGLCPPGQRRELNLTPLGGAYNRVPSDATAYVHRDERFLVEHVVTADPAESAPLAAASTWLTGSWATVHPYGSGRVYPNFPDPGLEDWADAYYGGNYGRLLAVKQAYDPGNWFCFPQSLGSPARERTRHA